MINCTEFEYFKACPALLYKPVGRVEAACASGSLALSYAVESIQAGSNVCLVVGAEVQNTVSARQGGDYLARASHYKYISIYLILVSFY